MQHYWSLAEVDLHRAWLTIGSFDGVHRGHQDLIQQLTAGAHQIGAPAVVLTFYPHPGAVLRSRTEPFYLTSPDERAQLLGQAGVDFVITHPFNQQVAATTAGDFMRKLHKHLGIAHLLIGHDFALGKNRKGDFSRLTQIGVELGYQTSQIAPFYLDEQLVSSSHIRFLLGAGKVEEAARMLGRNYTVTGKVEIGDQRGRTIGVPTANLNIWAERAIPVAGVYACWAHLDDQRYAAVTNIGVRPTFEFKAVPPRVETHLLDFNQDIYGAELQLEFIQRLRDEQRFPDINTLVTQIRADIQQARQILA
ncbi:MAG: bifunctional riboflavin kinase/FAD synthetase [Anaerolineales bacterium]|nr:bifunctional riboflavin kinase/FAD synthetase [Anaerolineales bacterium]